MIRIVLLLTVFTSLADISTASPRTPAFPKTAASPRAAESSTTASLSKNGALPAIVPALLPLAPYIPIPLHIPAPPHSVLPTNEPPQGTAGSSRHEEPPTSTSFTNTTKPPRTTSSSKTTKSPRTTSSSKTTKASKKTSSSKTTKSPRTVSFSRTTTSSSKTTKASKKTSSSKTTKLPRNLSFNRITKSPGTKSSSKTTTSIATIAATPSVSWKTTKLEAFAERLENECDFSLLDSISKELKNLWEDVTTERRQHMIGETDDVQQFIKQIIELYNKCTEKRRDIDIDSEWEIYLKIYGKEYNATEKEMRKSIFKKNKIEVEKHNELYNKGTVSYKSCINYYSDWTESELDRMSGFRPSNSSIHSHHKRKARFVEGLIWKYYYNPKDEMPDFVDWRIKSSYVTPVTNQGKCASCYAFAGIGALETYHRKRTGYLVQLSVQNILDCTWHLRNSGCDGGTIFSVFQYAEQMGVLSNSDYPYTMNASYNNCQWKHERVVAADRGYEVVEYNNELALQSAVATEGPVAVGIGTRHLSRYHSGVFAPIKCGSIDHAVLVVGYGTDPVEGEYWLVKNWWGFFWGEDGYVRIGRNKKNICNIASHSYLPY